MWDHNNPNPTLTQTHAIPTSMRNHTNPNTRYTHQHAGPQLALCLIDKVLHAVKHGQAPLRVCECVRVCEYVCDVCMCVCVCVCVYERERERESVCVCVFMSV